MDISVATANLYYLPFEQTLEIIASAGFEYIELDLPYENGEWAMAQHLKGMDVREAVRLVDRAGLCVSSIHDGGGVVDDADSIEGFINPELDRYLDQLGYAPGCIVFHTPHIRGHHDERWWRSVSSDIAAAASRFRTDEMAVTIETS